MNFNFGKGYWKSFEDGIQREWVITNGIGGYAGSSIINANTRKHHGLLIASLHPPVDRFLILSKINETLQIEDRNYSFNATQRPGWTENGHHHLQRSLFNPLPTFNYQVEDFFLDKTLALDYGKNTVVIQYSIKNGSKNVNLSLTPLFNFRRHGDRIERQELNFKEEIKDDMICLMPNKRKDVTIKFKSEIGEIIHRDDHYDEDMTYATEIATGMKAIDNHYTPYDLVINLKPYESKTFYVICTLEDDLPNNPSEVIQAGKQRHQDLITQAGYKDWFADTLVAASDDFIVHRQSTQLKTILAGLPWFADWGRDTMIAYTGLTLVTKRFEDAKEILWTFAKYVKNGLVPNMFPDEGTPPLYNTADASLWYFYAVDQYLKYTNDYEFISKEIYPELKAIIEAYRNGTDFSINMDTDGLIHAGSGLDQITWMDVRVGEWVVTPRHGKPVEINALWYNALQVMAQLASRFGEDPSPYQVLAKQVHQSFNKKFWNDDKKCLYDVVDENDSKIRPNQIWAVSLPHTMLDNEKAKQVVQTVIQHLYASYGLRSLSYLDEDYIGIYKGQLIDRDAAYHQGTTWAFPLGGLITAYCKVHGYSKSSIAFARQLVAPIEDHLRDGCIGSIAEIFDGNEPIISRGCYAQAWSVGEILRAYVEDILFKGEFTD